VTLADVPLTVVSANEVQVLAQLPVALAGGTYRVRVVRASPRGHGRRLDGRGGQAGEV